jgi:hypothetical protein
MQYWVFFIGGVGGDGFTNLLEHASNIEPADSLLKWRIRSDPSDPKVSFWQPNYVTDNRLLRDHSDPNFDLSKIELLPDYYRTVVRGLNTVIPAHPHFYNYDKRFKFWDFIEKSQHKILLYSDNIDRVVDDFYDKNPESEQVGFRKNKKNALRAGKSPYYQQWNNTPILNYDTFIDIEKVWKDWDYLNNILISIGINLPRKYYEEYLDVSKRRPQY